MTTKWEKVVEKYSNKLPRRKWESSCIREIEVINSKIIELSSYGRNIYVSKDYKIIYDAIISGKYIPQLPSIFHGEIGPRENKDKVYSQFWDIVENHTQNKVYLGLPANQILSISKHCPTGTAYEMNSDMFRYMWKLKGLNNRCNIEPVFGNIVDGNYDTATVIDLDLMICLNSSAISPIVAKLANMNGESNKVVNITTSCARGISKEKYETEWKEKLEQIKSNKNYKVVNINRCGYRDRQFPMKTEHLVFLK